MSIDFEITVIFSNCNRRARNAGAAFGVKSDEKCQNRSSMPNIDLSLIVLNVPHTC